MKRIAVVVACLCVLAAPAIAQQQLDLGRISITCQITEISDNSYTLIGSRTAKVYIEAKDGTFALKADRVVISKDPKDPKSGYQTAKLTGGIWFRIETQPGKVTSGTADTGYVDYAKAQEAVLSGAVRVDTTDPDLFVGPATIVGDRAIISLNPKLGPDEAKIRIESSPAGSRLEFTPKKKAEEPAKKPEEKK